MQTASLAGLIETIFFIALFYYIFKFVMRLLLPMVLKKAVEKAEQNMRQHQQYYGNQPQDDHQVQTNGKPRETKKVGEYVDFEEIE